MSACSRLLPATMMAMVLSACTTIPPENRSDNDPWEPMNRTIFDVNMAIDRVTTKPLAKGYDYITPRPVRTGIGNFFRNLTTPRSSVNNFLQGKPKQGFSEFGRFLLNSTIGIGGLIDVATHAGMEEYREDFGQTAAVWGMPDGPYVMLPFLGPKTLRDLAFFPLDMAADPLHHYDNTSARDKLVVLRIINLRAQLLSVDKILKDSRDPYLTARESFLQNRNFEIYDGDPPSEDDDLFDEFLEED